MLVLQEPTTSLNRTERETLATESIDVLTSVINSTSGQIDGAQFLGLSEFANTSR